MVGKRKDKDYGSDWNDDFDDFFGEWGFDFDRFEERMKRIWGKLLKDPDAKTYGPYVYGFTYKVGPDGKPQFEEFGNVPESRASRYFPVTEKDVREPITDINEDQNKVYITYELPGVSKENVDLKVSDRNVTLEVKEDSRKYFKSIDFDYDLKTDGTVARFTNGILDVTIEKVGKPGTAGKKVTIQ